MKICFISKNVYPVASNSPANFAGGGEIQLLALAHKFKNMGNTVEFITDDFGQRASDNIDGIKYIKVPFRYMNGRKFHILRDWLILYHKMNKIQADVYILKGPRFNLFIVGLFGIFSKKRIVFISTIDTDSDPAIMRGIDHLHNRFLYWLGLQMVPLVVSQSDQQQVNFLKNFRKKTSIIKNIYSINKGRSEIKQSTALWVGTNKKVKRPDLFLEFARKTPEIKYRMAMVPSRNSYTQYRLEQEIKKNRNIEYLGFVPENEMGKIYAQSSVLVNVSELEGFPNVFLHAWAHKTPVVSLKINPDGIINKHKIGFCSGTMKQMINDVRLLFQNDQLRKEMGNNGYKYVKKEHDPDKIAQQYIRLFKEVN